MGLIHIFSLSNEGTLLSNDGTEISNDGTQIC